MDSQGCHQNINSGYNLYDNSNYSQSTFSSIADSKSTTLTWAQFCWKKTLQQNCDCDDNVLRKTLIAVNIRQAFIDNILLNQYHHNTVALSSRMGDTRQREILLSFSDAGLGFALVIQLF